MVRRCVAVWSLAAALATTGGCLEDDGPPNFAEFDRAGSVTLRDVVATAQDDQGGFATDAELEAEDGEFLFAVVVFRGGQLWEYELRPSDGSIVNLELEDDNANTDMIARISEFDPTANITQIDAVEIAEAELPGALAVEVELDTQDIEFSWEVYLYHDAAVWEVEINPVDGSVLETEIADDYGED